LQNQILTRISKISQPKEVNQEVRVACSFSGRQDRVYAKAQEKNGIQQTI